MSFQSRLKEARIAKEYTQEQLANLIGVAKSTYTGYEKGNREPNMLTVSKIIDVLGIDANFLWQDEMNASDNNTFTLEYAEIELLKKYRAIAERSPKGKETIDALINREYERCYEFEIGLMNGVVTIYDIAAKSIEERNMLIREDAKSSEAAEELIELFSKRDEKFPQIPRKYSQNTSSNILFPNAVQAARNNSESEPGEQEKMQEDIANLKRPE